MKMKKFIILMLMLIGMMCSTVHAQHVAYISREVPTFNTSVKTWMPYRACAWGSPQRNFSESSWCYTDSYGFRRAYGESDFGVNDDYYLVAMGSYYSRTIGDKFRVTTDTGRVFYVVLAEFKDDRHTNSTHQWGTDNKDVLEFLVDSTILDIKVKRIGSCNVHMPLNGSIVKLEEMNFILE